ncbi:divalent metal cation transporter [Streptomyces venezuelae]|uniref:divalent metal cation transporter n=1 Tax=Streptomyces sp. B6(2022) TaxID=3404749 RepID=UPI0031202623
MKRFLAVTLGILTAIGGFVDIGDLVASSLVGARFGFALVWVLLLGVVGICVYAEMAGRVAAVSGRPTFDIVRERLGPRMAFANLTGPHRAHRRRPHRHDHTRRRRRAPAGGLDP